ncbi:hypothetical protein CXK86_21370 [Paenibacillus sp. BGI2013]|nr:hypothetical protein BK136_17725 [Paenibacillus amylolyticus]PKQ89123.1 hypothetical protein CXK86_21370 [Paenibacillus sp. BGI2013]
MQWIRTILADVGLVDEIMERFKMKEDEVKTLVFVCLTGQIATDILKQAGIKTGNILARQAIKKIPNEVD